MNPARVPVRARPASARARPVPAGPPGLSRRGAGFKLISDADRQQLLAAMLARDGAEPVTAPQKGLFDRIASALKTGRQHQDWGDVCRMVKETKDAVKARTDVLVLLNHTGIPLEHRAEIWPRLLGNPGKITKSLFAVLLATAAKTPGESARLAQTFKADFQRFKDLERFSQLAMEVGLVVEMLRVS